MRKAILLITAAGLFPASTALAQNYEYTSAYQPDLAQIGVTPTLHNTINGTGIGIAILDGYAATSHPDLAGKIDTTLLYGGTYNGADGHGTHVSGTAAGARNNIGIVGVAPGARIHNYPVFDTRGWVAGDLARSVLDHIKARNNSGANIRAINMSYGPTGRGDLFLNGELNIFDDYTDQFVIVRAAGNSGVDIGWESYSGQASAALSHILVVGSVGANNVISAFSNKAGTACMGPTRKCTPSEMVSNFFIVAPGERIASSYPGGWAWMSGTSMAAPHVAGAVALVAHDGLLRNVALTPSDIAGILKRSAKDLGAPGVDPVYGWGLLDVPKALAPVGPTVVATAPTVTTNTVSTKQTRRPRRRNTGTSDNDNDDDNRNKDKDRDDDDLLRGMVVFDDYGRPFEVDGKSFDAPRRAQFGDRLDTLPTISASHEIAGFRSEGFSLVGWSTAPDALAPAASFRLAAPGFDMHVAIGAPNVGFGLAQSQLGVEAEAQSLDAMMFAALGEASHIFDRTVSAGVTFELAEGWDMSSFALGSFNPTALDMNESLLILDDGHQGSLAGVAVERRLSPSLTLGVAYGALHERGSVVGDEYQGAFSFGEATLTQTASVTFAARLSDTIVLDGFYSRAFIDAYGAVNSIFQQPQGWTGSQFGLTATSSNLFGAGDALRVSLIKPLQITHGTISARVPVGREFDGTVRYDLRNSYFKNAPMPGNLRLEYLSPTGPVRAGLALDVLDDDIMVRNALRFGVSASLSYLF